MPNIQEDFYGCNNCGKKPCEQVDMPTVDDEQVCCEILLHSLCVIMKASENVQGDTSVIAIDGQTLNEALVNLYSMIISVTKRVAKTELDITTLNSKINNING